MDFFKSSDFDELQTAAQNCKKCIQMCDRKKVLTWANGDPSSEIMFIAEAPGRLGAEETMVPLHGDKAGDNFERLLSNAGLDRRDVFITNAVLCNPQTEAGNNRPPSKVEIINCSSWLKEQIDLINPKVVVTLGAAALKATSLISDHDLELSKAVRTKSEWYNRLLIPLYHPGQRAMIHRSFANQSADYYFVSEALKRSSQKPTKYSNNKSISDERGKDLVKSIVSQLGEVSQFQLHKLLFLVDYYHYRAYGKKYTSFHYIRQKDGPYCVSIAGFFGKQIEHVSVKRAGGRIVYRYARQSPADLFEAPPEIADIPFIETVIARYGMLSPSELKTSVYLTKPMKEILRREKSGSKMLNAPLLAA